MVRSICGHRMEKIYKYTSFKNAGLYLRYGLAFFLLTCCLACKQAPPEEITLVWQNGKATAISIPRHFVKDTSLAWIEQSLHVVLEGRDNRLGILGDFELTDNSLVFRPVIPFSPGLSYDIWQKRWLLGTVSVPHARGAAPTVKAIYPEADTVPENLLKIYIRFSHAMRTGEALNHVHLMDKGRDTLQRMFLNLQPELWNKEGTVLTLWLDPGRIKRDLVLNRQLGNPLKRSQSYQFIITGDWKDTNGLPLGKDVVKQFAVTERDGDIPDINKWNINIPQAGTSAPLKISTGEHLDHYLLYDSLWIIDDKGAEVKGDINVGEKDMLWMFTPAGAWKAGHYQLKIYSRLEDLAGNNLNRVFDRDIRKDTQQNKVFFIREFEVK